MWRRKFRKIGIHKLMFPFTRSGARRVALYDRLYSIKWDETNTNNYGFAPAELDRPERFQLQLYTELLKMLGERNDASGIAHVLEISCGRGGGLGHLKELLPRQAELVGLDSSRHAIRFCQEHYAAVANLTFVHGNALDLPFKSSSFDLVINVEASHAYGDDAAFLREVRRVLRPRGRFLLADYRTRRKISMLEQLARAAGLAGDLRDITPNVVSACELDAERRRRLIHTGLPWYARLLLATSLEGYSGLPGTRTYDRFRSEDRMYFLSCMAPRTQHVDKDQGEAAPLLWADAGADRRWS